MKTSTASYGLASVILAVVAAYIIHRRRNPGNDSDPFVGQLLTLSAQQISKALAINDADVEQALLRCRTGDPNDLARKLNARIDCSLKKVSASKLAVVLSAAYKKDGKLMVTRIEQEVSWDDLPGEIRSRFITENPDELCYVIVEQPCTVGTEQFTPI